MEEPPPYAIFILATTEKHKIIPTILSRCQIFDFNRIQVNDIVSHLSKIVERENLNAEPEALHVIGQKADGALRDALSIFDLIKTFAGGEKITYKEAIENLHILDYDYYFKLVDCLGMGDHGQSLLLFDEILAKGFDGHHFIVGLADHVRNLLVCKDERTLQLLEVTEGVKDKYGIQAKSLSTSFLLSTLNILNQFDIHYKASKNQRLHVELMLFKLAHINDFIGNEEISSSPNDGQKKKIIA